MAGDVPTVRNPIRMSATPARYDLAPPGLDEQGAEIRAWLIAERTRSTAKLTSPTNTI